MATRTRATRIEFVATIDLLDFAGFGSNTFYRHWNPISIDFEAGSWTYQAKISAAIKRCRKLGYQSLAVVDTGNGHGCSPNKEWRCCQLFAVANRRRGQYRDHAYVSPITAVDGNTKRAR
jgi:hypothetical protein